MKTGALIVAAGHDKDREAFRPMLPVGDSTVIRRIIITMKQAGIDPIVVVTGSRGDELEKHIAKLRVICLRNERYEDTQMFYSICLGLNYMEDLCDRVFVLPAKFPMFLPRTMKRLMAEEAPVVCPSLHGRRGHPILISREMIRPITSFKGAFGLRGALEQPQMQEKIREIPVEDEGIILAVDSEEDCAQPGVESGRIAVHPQISLELGRNEEFFSPFMAQFLSITGHTGSMQTACRQMHMSYTKGWSMLKAAERQLGFPILVTRSGGAEGGFSQLTPKASEFLNRYLAMEQALRREGERLFGEYFPEYGGDEPAQSAAREPEDGEMGPGGAGKDSEDGERRPGGAGKDPEDGERRLGGTAAGQKERKDR